jgi:hypothetical protein
MIQPLALLPALGIHFPKPAKLIGGSLGGDETSNSKPMQGVLQSRLSAMFRRPNSLFPLSQLFRHQVI